jgi:hypothetical protein
MKFSVHFLDIQQWWTYSEQTYTVTFIEISVRFEDIHITYNYRNRKSYNKLTESIT